MAAASNVRASLFTAVWKRRNTFFRYESLFARDAQIHWGSNYASALINGRKIVRTHLTPCHKSFDIFKDFPSGHGSPSLHTTINSFGDIVPFLLSDIGEGIREVSVKEWFVKVGDKVNQFDPICEVQSDKASVTITSRYDGIIRKLHHELDETALVGKALIDIEIDGEGMGSEEQVDLLQDTVPVSENYLLTDRADRVLATPAVRRIAIENNIRLSDVKGRGKDGRVLKEDILCHVEMLKQTTSSESLQHTSKIPSVRSTAVNPSTKVSSLDERIEAIKGFRKAMVNTMTAALRVPHFGYADELHLDKLVTLRHSIVKEFDTRHGVRITYLPFFVKAASLALSRYPILNASVDDKCENIIYKAVHNIGIAMNTPQGLVVPNVKNVQSRSVLEIATEINRLQELGTKGKLGTDDITGGTFTLSNIGVIGGTYMKPIILPPEVVIGAIGKIQVLPRFDDRGNVYGAHIVQVSWSADHRVIDGATMANFSTLWKSYLESPGTMLLALK